MTRSLSEYLNPWEHCPECGALLMTAPGSLYCSHCGFEEAIFEGPVRLHQRLTRACELGMLEAEPDGSGEQLQAPVSEAA